MPASVLSRYSRRTVAGMRQQRLLEEKAGQPETIDPLAGQVLGNDCIRMANGPASESTF
jgi:hypothetical protein